MFIFNTILFVVSMLAGGVACITGFGIGSLITPLLALKVGTGVAVAGVCVAHFEIWDASTYAAKEQCAMADGLPDALKNFSF